MCRSRKYYTRFKLFLSFKRKEGEDDSARTWARMPFTMANIMCLLLTMFGQLLARGVEGSLLGLKLHEAGQDFLTEYLSADEVKYLTELNEFQQQDTAIEIDLIGEKAKHRSVYQPPRVLYQIGVSLIGTYISRASRDR